MHTKTEFPPLAKSWANLIRTFADTARSALYRDGNIVIVMQSREEFRFPVSKNPRLARATPEQLSHIELSPCGIHWPDLAEDLSFRGIAQGDYGRRRAKQSN